MPARALRLCGTSICITKVTTMSIRLRWKRRAPNSDNNFDLVLVNPEDLDVQQLLELLEAVKREEHRGLTLSGRAIKEWERFLHNPTSALKSEAFVLLSN